MQAIDNTKILKAARAVPCIEVLEGPAPDRAKKFCGPYYPDQSEVLENDLKNLRRRERFMVALNPEGLVNIYRKSRRPEPEKATA